MIIFQFFNQHEKSHHHHHLFFHYKSLDNIINDLVKITEKQFNITSLHKHVNFSYHNDGMTVTRDIYSLGHRFFSINKHLKKN